MNLGQEPMRQSQVAGAGPGNPSFAAQVRGQGAQDIDKTLSRLMRDLYDYDADGVYEGFGDWRSLSDEQMRQAGIDPALLKDEKSGFLAQVYGDAQGRRVVAYSGTDEGKDWLTNLGQGVGFDMAQYRQAIELGRQAKVAFGEQVVFTGHSLGGGLAAAAAVAADVPTVTFNAAGLNDKTIERLGIDPDWARQHAEEGLIRRYAVKNEILTDLQEHSIPLKWAMPDAVGHKIELPDPDPQTFWQRINPVQSVRHGVEMHLIHAVIEAQDLARPEPRQTAATPLLSDDAHPIHRLYSDALGRVHELDRRQGIASGPHSTNLAGVLADRAGRAGLTGVDRVALSQDGTLAFAVQGGMQSPFKRWVQADVAQAIATPLEESSRLAAQYVREQSMAPQPEVQEQAQAAQRRGF